jgi:predicted secreted protein with PEFG-CTERM motif
MKNYFVMSILILSASSMAQNNVFADGTNNFGILASSYINTSPGTSITGDVGYTTGPAVPATVSGNTHVADSIYQQAGTVQNTATSIANSQVCTTHLGTSVDLSLVHNGVYSPGVYCTTGAASIGSGGITLSGNGIYIFQINGALTTVVNSGMTLSYGAQASDVSWVPTQATTLGANSNFAGIILDASGVTIGHGVSMTGKVLAFGGTVSTSADIISVPSNMMSDATNNNFTSLGTAGNFAVLGSTSVTNTGNTVVTGNLGLSPGTSVVGFPPGVVTGINHITDSSAAQARVDATTAYGALSNTACTTNESLNADIGGKTLGPGVYCFPSSAAITGTLTLSGNGVYIFQIPSTLVAAAGPGSTSNIVLTNGASASNVFWQVGSSATLGTGSVFKGTIIAYKSITATTGATVEGRLLALTGAVTLDANHVTIPSNTMSDAISNNFQCTVTFPTGTIDLGSNVQYPAKVYPPGVYCIDGIANIDSGPITLTGSGAHVFKINGALNQAANTDVILSNGAQVSGVIWVPTGPTTIGANSHLIGTVNGAPITIGANSDINGIGPAKTMADAVSGNFQCTVTFPTGTIDLGSNVQYPAKVYPPGVYCIDGIANIGSGPITLTGNGNHIFKINGALNQAANTDVILVDGAQVSSVIWVPTGPVTIGANSHLIGTVNGAPITIGANSDINGIGPVKTMADSMSPPLYATGDTTVPEFGAISAMILVIGIVSIIAISARTGLRLVPKY